MNLINVAYAEFVAFFKANPAIWYTIQQMMEEKESTYQYLSQFIDNEPPMISGHEEGNECFGCVNCFIPNPKFKGYK